MNINYEAEHEGYVVIGHKGHILPYTFATLKNHSIRDYMIIIRLANIADKTWTWRKARRELGVRCVRATIFIDPERANI